MVISGIPATSPLDLGTSLISSTNQLNVDELLDNYTYLTKEDDSESSPMGPPNPVFKTMGSTSDMSLPEGMTETLDRDLNQTVDSESDLKQSGKYPDSLEGTGGKNGEGSYFLNLTIGFL